MRRIPRVSAVDGIAALAGGVAQAAVLTSSLALPARPCSAEGATTPARFAELVEATLDMKSIGEEERPVFSPAGDRLAYVLESSRERPLRQGEISPDASARQVRLAVRPKTLFVMDVSTGETRRVSEPLKSAVQPSWSPDGRSVAYYSEVEGELRVFAHDLRAGRSREVIRRRVAEGFRRVPAAQWSKDARTIYVVLAPAASAIHPSDRALVEVRRSGREVEPGQTPPVPARPPHPAGTWAPPGFTLSHAGDLVAVDLTSGVVRPIVMSNASAPPQHPYLSASGRRIAYLCPPRSNIWVAGGRALQNLPQFSADLAVVPERGGEPTLLARNAHVDGVRWHPVRDVLAFLDAGELRIVDFDASGEPAPRHLAQGAGFLSGPFAFTKDGSAILVLRTGGGSGPSLVQVPLDESHHRTMETPAGLLDPELIVDERGLLWQPERAFAMLALDRGRNETVVWRADFEARAGTEAWRAPGRLSVPAASEARPRLVGLYETPTTPPELYSFEPTFARQRQLTRHHVGLAEMAVQAMGSIEYFDTSAPDFDGSFKTVRAAVVLPPGFRRDGSARGIVCIYPGNDLSTTARLFGGGERCGVPTHVLTARGFVVILPHLLKRPLGTEGNVSQEYADALLPVAYKASGLGYVDSRRLALFGHSQGGYAAAATVSETNLFRAAVITSSASYDLIGTWGYTRWGFEQPNLWPVTGYLMSRPPWEDLKRYIGNSPYLQADRIDTPVLIAVGTNDRFPHDIEAGKLFTALRTYDKTAQLAVYEGEEHFLFRGTRTSARDLWNRMLEFLDRYVPKEIQ